jgi:hypothetical protein
MAMSFRPGSVVAITGDLGSGKTMCAVRLLLAERAAGRRVLANIPTVFAPRARYLEHFTETKRTSILWDELQESLDSREYRNNVTATRKAIFLRKRGNVLFYTVPDISMVDKRIRLLTNYIVACQVLRTGLSLVAMYRASASGAIRLVGKHLLYHHIWGGFYDSYDEDVLLLPFTSADVPVTLARKRAPGRGNSEAPRPGAGSSVVPSLLESLQKRGV